MPKKEKIRCAGCGKLLEPDEVVVSIQIGVFKNDGGVHLSGSWGTMHESCFNRAVGTPKSVLEEIKKIAKRKVR